MECWWLVRKPLSEKTVAENVLKYGTGGINIDGSRVHYEGTPNPATNPLYRKKNDYKIICGNDKEGTSFKIKQEPMTMNINDKGRFPSHLIHDDSDEVLAEFAKAGEKSGCQPHKINSNIDKYEGWGNITKRRGELIGYEGIGTAARFFYCAKADREERYFYCKVCDKVENLRDKHRKHSMHCNDCNINYEPEFNTRIASDGIERAMGGISQVQGGENLRPYHFSDSHAEHKIESNITSHPTQKSLELMQYLIKLITPPNGTVFDPLAGSGSTLVAAKQLGFNSIGIEIDETYFKIAEKRIAKTGKQRRLGEYES